MLASAAIRDIPLVLLLPVIGFTQQAPAKPLAIPPSQTTLFVNCQANEKPKKVLSPVSLSEDGTWRAYVEVDVRSDLGCAHTTRLWVARANAPYRLVYLMSPERTAVENGMEILGWARNSRMILVRTEEWQFASDALDTPRVLAINAETGMVYAPRLEAMFQTRQDKNCSFRVVDAGFSADRNVNILVRAQFFDFEDGTGLELPPAMRCGNAEETWSFNFATGEIKQVANSQPLLIFKKSLPNRRDQ